MAVNTTTLVNAVQTRVDGITASCDNKDILLAAVAANRAITAEGHKKVTVATVNDLPNLDTSGVGSGHMVFVESINVPVVSGCDGWYGLDRRQLRKDAPERRLWVWGYNYRGALGIGNQTDQSSPVTTISGGINWCQVSIGNCYSTAIKTDGTLWTWGDNGSGQLGTANGAERSSPGTTVAGGTNWCQVAAGGQANSSAIKTDGTLWTWGLNNCGQLGTYNTITYSSPVTTSGGGTNWCQVSNADRFSSAIKTDGTLWTWGYNIFGSLGTGNSSNQSSPVTTSGGGTNWCQVDVGYCSGSAIKTDGTLWGWGYNASAQLGTGNTTSYSSPVTTAGGGTNWCQVSQSGYIGGAIKTDGTLWVWGDNTYGQLGTGNTTSYSSPVTTVGGGTNWCSISKGASNGFALKTDGTLWVWGANSYGMLGTGNLTNYSSPVTTSGGGTNWCQVYASAAHTAAITSTL